MHEGDALLDCVHCGKYLGAGTGASSSGARLGELPSAGAINWIPTLATLESPRVSDSGGSGDNSSPVPTSSSGPVTSDTTLQTQQVLPTSPTAVVPTGSYMGGGLLPVPEKLVIKITRLEFVEMQELMPDTWLREEEGPKLLAWPRRRSAPVTNILQWLSCYSVMVGVLSRTYTGMVPEFMAYQATVIRCYRDFEGLAWAHAVRQGFKTPGGSD